MGIFSFGKKDETPTRRGANTSSTRAARGERVERRTRRTERPDADAMLLDPTLPEKQRARRRLVGAIAMVVAAVVILPMVLDSHPKPVTDDISIDIPNRPAPKAAADDEDTQAGVAPDNPAPDSALAASGVVPAPAAPATANAMSQQQGTTTAPAQAGSKSNKSPAPAMAANTAPAAPTQPPAPAKPVKVTPAPTQSAANTSATSNNTDAAAADADSGTPASPPGSRFAVQLGSFPDDASAKSWAAKLKAAGVPAYTERRKQADGTTHTLLRAGPFADRAAASAAIAKVREAGLTSGSNNGSAQ
ncbi:SPOR domain-containing protein [Paraburkholderia phenazinium]|uniref:DedD protein n=1 Tax=Paraburkholderia phenazinium TaxID=60549 RepID=A0A1G8KLD0_9BURK|nr:SPOR domain-containing protein [Paraburkholderia phenazinium]SDI44208.1 DedD protein [Paraburkholderia phenazinium]